MIAYKGREGKRAKVSKMNRTLERLYREGKCRDCSVVVTRMDFAKILGKFTKVKIQYASSSAGKTQKPAPNKKTETQAPVSNTRLKNNDNGMVLIQRTSYTKHPVKDLLNVKKQKSNKNTTLTQRQTNMNILKENNALKYKTPIKDKNSNYNNQITSNGKQYTIIFDDPSSNITDIKSDLCLLDLLPKVEKSILPSEEWCIDYFPKQDEPKNDKVYDRIAAELEDLMYNEKPDIKSVKPESSVNKPDEFPSIMDILNDNVAPANNSEPKDQSNNIDFKDNLESSDVEAMLLGKTSDSKMDVDNTDVNKLISDVVQFSANSIKEEAQEAMELENPHSPSILDEALQKGIEEHLPNNPLQDNCILENSSTIDKNDKIEDKNDSNLENNDEVVVSSINSETTSEQSDLPSSLNIPSTLKIEDVTHVIFKKVVDGKCLKSVACPKNLKYSIELEEKPVEFLGAPKYISSLEDLQVLLQIVHETDLKSLYVLH